MFLPDPSVIQNIDLRGLVDDINDSTVGYPFIADHRNHLHGGRRRMLYRLKTSPEWAAPLKFGCDGFELEIKGWPKYQTQLEKFKNVLFVLMHICGGAPARGPEVPYDRARQRCSEHANIFVVDGRVVFVTAYHKSRAITGQHKVIPRFLPSRVGQLLVVYLADVLSSSLSLTKTAPQVRSGAFCGWTEREFGAHLGQQKPWLKRRRYA